MGPASNARPSDTGASNERSAAQTPRRSDSGIERRVPNARETLATLPELDAEPLDFEPHDTIPAPPWLGEPEEQKSSPTSTR